MLNELFLRSYYLSIDTTNKVFGSYLTEKNTASPFNVELKDEGSLFLSLNLLTPSTTTPSQRVQT